MIHLDTSVVIDALTGPRRSAAALRSAIERGERIALSSLVLFEWRRGPRLGAELRAQEALFPAESVVTFGAHEARLAAGIYLRARRPRGRGIDIAIAACAIASGAKLWSLNPADFADLPDLALYDPAD